MRQHEMHTLTQGIVSSHRARSSALALLLGQAVAQRREAQSHLRDLGKGRQAAAGEQRAALSRGRAALLKVRPTLRSAGRQRRSAVQGWLKVVATARQAAAGEQGAALSRGRAALLKVRPTLRAAGRQRRSAVKGWLKELARDSAAAHREWHDRFSAMRAVGAGAVAAAEAPRPVTSAAPVEEAGEEELASLGRRIFDYLASQPNGTRLTEIEEKLSMGRFQAARVVRHLTEAGKVEKRDLLYYAI